MNILYKTTLLITMAVVTWKVLKIESYLRPKKTKININLNCDADKIIHERSVNKWNKNTNTF